MRRIRLAADPCPLLEIRSRAEGAVAGPPDNAEKLLVVRGEGIEGCFKLVVHGHRDCIHRLRAVERDGGDAVGNVDANRLVFHGELPVLRCSASSPEQGAMPSLAVRLRARRCAHVFAGIQREQPDTHERGSKRTMISRGNLRRHLALRTELLHRLRLPPALRRRRPRWRGHPLLTVSRHGAICTAT